MPRILRNYLISFAVIGAILLVVHLLDLYFHADQEAPQKAPSQTSSLLSPERGSSIKPALPAK
ncbi:MAG: hypothetical protein HQM14_06615 [SAR324 cluster bacterium]|nr:hypothetical protein [SAR324 cluster bacterium]